MKVLKTVLCLTASVAALAIIGALAAPKVRAAIKATFVEVVFPSRPYSYTIPLGLSTDYKVAGPGTGTLGITSLTFRNADVNPQDVWVANPVLSGNAPGTCSGTVSNTNEPGFYITVPARSTLHLPYPTPLVFNPNNGSSCIAVQDNLSRTYGLNVTINGFVN